jgi:TIR domain
MKGVRMRWDVFVSRASEDKADVAMPLTKALRARGLRVWLDRHELKIGDSLRASIDEGLASSRFGVVIVSDAFLGKRWPLWELNGLVAVEGGGGKTVLPVWHGIDHATVVRHSPMLADRIAANTADGIEQVATAIAAVVLAEPGGTPAVDTPTVAGRLLEVVQRGDLLAVTEFLATHPDVLRNALGRSWKELRRDVNLGGVAIDLCVGTSMPSIRAWRWRGIVLGSTTKPPVGATGDIFQWVRDLAVLVAGVGSWTHPTHGTGLPNFSPTDFKVIVVLGRRGKLTEMQSAALRRSAIQKGSNARFGRFPGR